MTLGYTIASPEIDLERKISGLRLEIHQGSPKDTPGMTCCQYGFQSDALFMPNASSNNQTYNYDICIAIAMVILTKRSSLCIHVIINALIHT